MEGPAFKPFHSIEIFVFSFIAIFTYILSLYYVAGDQLGYHNAYRVVRGVGLWDAFHFYGLHISTSEPVHFIFFYMSSNLLLDKNIVFSILNGVLSVVVVRALKAAGVHPLVYLFLIFTNYYFYVMYLSAERLKIAAIFVIAAAFLARSLFSQVVFSVFAIMSHLSGALLFAGFVFARLLSFFYEGTLGSRRFLLEVFALSLSLVLAFFLFGEYVFWKLSQYARDYDFNVSSMGPMLACFFAALFYSGSKRDVLFDFFAIFIAFAVLGGDRINMFAYIVFLKYALPVNSGLNWGVAITFAYFSLKSLFFIRNIIESGQGF